MKSTKTSTKTNKSVSNSQSTVCENLYLLPSGVYRARRQMNGTIYSRNFTNKAKAKAWLNTL